MTTPTDSVTESLERVRVQILDVQHILLQLAGDLSGQLEALIEQMGELHESAREERSPATIRFQASHEKGSQVLQLLQCVLKALSDLRSTGAGTDSGL